MTEDSAPATPDLPVLEGFDPDSLTWDEISDVLGSDLLSFVLNLPAGSVPDGDDSRRQEVLGTLRQLVAKVSKEENAFQRGYALHSALTSTHVGTNSWSNAARLHCGGELPDTDSDDDLCVLLSRLAVDLFPGELLPINSEDPSGGNHLWGFIVPPDHPCMSLLVQLVSTDPDLSALFPTDPKEAQGAEDNATMRELYSITSGVIWSSSSGGSIQWVMAVNSAVHYIYTNMRLEGNFNLSHIAEYVAATVTVIRRLANGQKVTVKLVASLSNIVLDENVRAVLPHGQIVSSQGISNSIPRQGDDVTAVLFTEVELQLLEVMPASSVVGGDIGDFDRKFRHHAAAIQASSRAAMRELDKARLSIVLGSDSQQVASPILLGWGILNPLQESGWVGRLPGSVGTFAPVRNIDPSMASLIAESAETVRMLPESMRLGVRRLLSAATERSDPLDGFVDAVVCWENMVGTGEGETTFRVCAGVAFLLEPSDPARRASLFRELKKLYSDRSGLVHGSREPSPEVASTLRDRSVEVAILAMREILLRTELRETNNSGERSRIILLGA